LVILQILFYSFSHYFNHVHLKSIRMNKCLITIFLVFSSLSLFGQNPESSISNKDEQQIEALIIKVFDGMRLGDSSMVRSCFYKEVEMYSSYTNRNGESVLKKGDFEEFLTAIGTPHDEVWDEKIWDLEVRIDNNLGQAWTKYAFYVGKKFSHCGVDAFHLTKTSNGWKIFHITDTRQRANCNLPEDKKE